jgi:hypothetical protein
VIAGFTPFPYKVITITSDFVSYNRFWFVALSILIRGARLYLVATLLYFWGDWARELIKRRPRTVGNAFGDHIYWQLRCN